MTIAAKHLDPVVGVDIHIILIPTPAGPVPTPLPNPFVGIVMDPFDYAPYLGATVKINGLPRAQAGTGVMNIAHMPLGGPFGPPPPGNEGEIFMGSSTVAVDGDAQSHLGLPIISCQSIGIPALPRLKGSPPKSLVLPTSIVLSVPMGPPVLVGGSPTVSLMALGFRAAMALLGPLGRAIRRAQRGAGRVGRTMRAITARARRAGDRLADALRLGARGRNRINRAICTVTGHPVDVATGKVFTDKIDLELPGALPFKWQRVWMSTSTYRGPLGHGWHHPYDQALYVTPEVALYRNEDGRLIAFPPLDVEQEYFDRAERLTLLRDRLGYSIRNSERVLYHFQDIGRPNDELVLRAISDPVGNEVLLHYDSHKRLVEIIDSAGRSMQLQNDARGQLRVLSAPHPDDKEMRLVVASYDYDTAGNLIRVRDALDQPAIYRYAEHLLVQETDRNGLSFYFEYDLANENAKCIRTFGDGGLYDHKLLYQRLTTVVTNSLGHTTRYQHDGALVNTIIDALGASTEIEWNEWYERIREKDALGGVTRWEYDELGNTVKLVSADGSKLTLSYGDFGRPCMAIDAIGSIWSWRYDEQGRLLERIDPLGHSARFVYADRVLVSATLGEVTLVVTHDQHGNLTGVSGPGGLECGFRYDLLGRQITIIDPLHNEERRSFDANGRVVRIDEPDGNVRSFVFNPEGDVLRVTERQHDVQFTYFGLGRVSTRTEAGTTVGFTYDTEEQLTGVINEHGYVFRFELGPTGEVDVENGFDGMRRRYQRDALGRVLELERASGTRARYSYDRVGRLLTVDYSDGGRERYTYRADGELIAADSGDSRLRFELDALGQITCERQGDYWVSNEYGVCGERLRVRSSLGHHQQISFDACGRVERVSAPESGWQARFRRDQLGQELDRELPCGSRSRWTRDTLGRPTQHEVVTYGKSARAVSYQWQVDDRLTALIDALEGPSWFEYDALGALAAARRPTGVAELRMPDAVGNLFRTEGRNDRTYGAAGQLLEQRDRSGVTQYRYDADGNLIEKLMPSGRSWKYEWNAAGMLARVVRPDGLHVTFAYDALGRRTRKCFAGRVTCFVWDGHVPLHEWVQYNTRHMLTQAELASEEAIAIQRRQRELSARPAQGPPGEAPITWVFEPDRYAPLAKLTRENNYSIVCDHLGTPVTMVDASGEAYWSAELDIYGKVRLFAGEPGDCAFRWPGHYEDEETGLYYARYRYYDPDSGEHISQDPIGLEGGTALYAYVSDPLVWFDPLGLAGCHGNSRASRRSNHVYVIRNRHTGEVYKYGISGGRVRLDGRSARAEAQVRRLNAAGGNVYESTIIGSNLTRERALRMEQGRVNGYSVAQQRAGRASGPTAPPGNLRPRATM